MKIPALLFVSLCLLSAGCQSNGTSGPTEETGRDLGGQTQGTSFPGSTGAGSQATTGSVGGGRANAAPSGGASTGGSR